MTEEQAKEWIAAQFGWPSVDRLSNFVARVVGESRTQNLIASSTMDVIWSRHVADSAQLLCHAPQLGTWLDVGTGGGFPGLVIALLREQPTILVEPRRRRAAFLQACVDQFQLPDVSVVAQPVEQVVHGAAVISARAVAPVEKLLHAAAGCATLRTRWILPRGRSARHDLNDLQLRWKGVFHVEQSLTDPDAGILLLEQVKSR